MAGDHETMAKRMELEEKTDREEEKEEETSRVTASLCAFRRRAAEEDRHRVGSECEE